MTDTNVSLLALMSQNTVSFGETFRTRDTRETGMPDFSDLLNQTGKAKDVIRVAQTGDASVQSSDSRASGNLANDVAKNVDSGKKTVKEADGPVSAKDKIEKKLSGGIQDEESEPVDVEEMLLQISTQILQIVSQGLGIEPEQLSDAMDQLGLTVGDLLDSSNLANLYGYFNEEVQPLELLTDPEFQNLLTQLDTLTGEVARQMNSSMSETVALLSQALEETKFRQEIPDIVSEEQPEMLFETAETQELVSEAVETTVTDQKMQQEMSVPTVEKDLQPVEEGDSETFLMETEEPMVVTESDSENASLMEEENTSEEDFFEKQEKNVFHESGENQQIVSTHSQSTMIVTPEGTVTEQTVKVVDLQNLVSEITEYVKLTSTSNQISSIEMQLNPANLGKVLVEVATQQGEVTAKISTQTEAAKEAMEANVNVLKENLEQQGVKVNAVEVTVQSHAFEENLQEDGSKEQEQLAKEMQKENRRMNLNLNEMTLDDLQGLMSEEDLVIAKMMRDNGNVINIGA